jgi:multiple sugar transport system ATP-binding protein
MELGVKQQMGEPQDVYDEPDNLFVAKFLGTPPINIFDGEVIEGKVKIGGVTVGKAESKDMEVFVGIRPEGFEVVERGSFKMTVYQVETIGRDTTLLVKQNENDESTQRIIVDAQYRIKPGDVVKFKVKPQKMFIFNKETGELLS